MLKFREFDLPHEKSRTNYVLWCALGGLGLGGGIATLLFGSWSTKVSFWSVRGFVTSLCCAAALGLLGYLAFSRRELPPANRRRRCNDVNDCAAIPRTSSKGCDEDIEERY
jgi:hypothetical protein